MLQGQTAVSHNMLQTKAVPHDPIGCRDGRHFSCEVRVLDGR